MADVIVRLTRKQAEVLVWCADAGLGDAYEASGYLTRRELQTAERALAKLKAAMRLAPTAGGPAGA